MGSLAIPAHAISRTSSRDTLDKAEGPRKARPPIVTIGQSKVEDHPRLGEYLAALKESGADYTLDSQGNVFEPSGGSPAALTQGQRKMFVDRQPYDSPVQGLTPGQRELYIDRPGRERERVIGQSGNLTPLQVPADAARQYHAWQAGEGPEPSPDVVRYIEGLREQKRQEERAKIMEWLGSK